MSEKPTEIQHYQKNWQQQLAEAINSLEDLCGYLHLSMEELPISVSALKNFPLRVPLNFADCMEKGNPNDPLLRQILPVHDEMTVYSGFSDDPVGDLSAATQAGILHKYHGRMLMINTGSCAINCRYCFRRNFPYADFQLSKQKELAAIQSIQDDTTVTEVILSGGDPLLLNDARLARLIRELSAIDRLQRIRIHSRLPIVLPARITKELVDLLVKSRKQIVLVIHCNHAKEINARVSAACGILKKNGITMFNQSVLLKGVNDNAEALCDLSEHLFSHGVIPYYLHLLDKAKGTGHFEVSRAEALAIIRQVQDRLPGYLVPRLVQEQAGFPAKQYVL
ncbi:MAG: EF-P beta-lysylation protein EpmB [Methylosarcina sp.]